MRQLVLLGLHPVIRADASPGPDGEISDSRPGDVVAMSELHSAFMRRVPLAR